MVIKKYLFKGPAVGWLNFDKSQIKRINCGYKTMQWNHLGEQEPDCKVWWCVFGFTGYFPINSLVNKFKSL